MTNDQVRRKTDRYPSRLWVILRSFFVVAGISATICFVLVAVTLSRVANFTPPPLPEKIVLTHVFKSDLAEKVLKPSLSQPLLRPATTLREVTEALEDAARDARVKGFVARIEDVRLNLAQVQELRAAIHAFRAAGKFAWVHADSFGGLSSGMADYYLASAFDTISMQPVGAVAVNGLAAEVPFAKDLLDKAGVKAEFGHQGRYKSMPESLTRNGMSEDNREMMQSLVSDLSAGIVAGIAKDRGLSGAAFRATMDASPFGEAEALARKLIDRTGYYDEMLKAAKEKAGVTDDKEIVRLTGYAFLSDADAIGRGMVGFTSKLLRQAPPPGVNKGRGKVALIYGVGEIMAHGGTRAFDIGGTSAAFGEGTMAADKIVAAFKSAEEDKDVAAVVFRIDSPGGSPEAAESIRRAVVNMRAQGRPVIVSMGGYAASGGYWIAADADKIVAQDATITGSIGVFGGKFDFSGLWRKIGLNWDAVAEGKNARMWSPHKAFTPEEMQKFDALLGGIYKAFIDRVAKGRGMTPEQVEAVAQGRVWTGRQAKEKGLVDEIGGLSRAIALAKTAAKLEAHAPVLEFPPRKSALELFLSLAVDGQDASVLLPPALDMEAATEFFARWNQSLRMPAVEVR